MVTLDEGGWLGRDAEVAVCPAATSDVIEHTFTLDMSGAAHRDWTVVPDGSAHIIATRAESTRVALVGARRTATRLDVRNRCWTVGIRLRPGALPLLTGLPAGDFTDRAVGLDELWHGRTSLVHDALAAATSAPGMLDALVAFVVDLPARSPQRDWRARALEKHLRITPFRVGTTAERMGLSVRSLRDVSTDLIGLAPKRLARIERLQRAIALAAGACRPAWSRIALRAGFADQAHLTREYRALMSETPGRYHRRGRRASCRFVQSRPRASGTS